MERKSMCCVGRCNIIVMLFLDLQVQWRRLVSVADKHVARGARGGGCREVSWGQEQIKHVLGGSR